MVRSGADPDSARFPVIQMHAVSQPERQKPAVRAEARGADDILLRVFVRTVADHRGIENLIAVRLRDLSQGELRSAECQCQRLPIGREPEDLRLLHQDQRTSERGVPEPERIVPAARGQEMGFSAQTGIHRCIAYVPPATTRMIVSSRRGRRRIRSSRPTRADARPHSMPSCSCPRSRSSVPVPFRYRRRGDGRLARGSH